MRSSPLTASTAWSLTRNDLRRPSAWIAIGGDCVTGIAVLLVLATGAALAGTILEVPIPGVAGAAALRVLAVSGVAAPETALIAWLRLISPGRPPPVGRRATARQANRPAVRQRLRAPRPARPCAWPARTPPRCRRSAGSLPRRPGRPAGTRQTSRSRPQAVRRARAVRRSRPPGPARR